MRTAADLVLARAGDERPGLVFEGRTWTWAEVVAEAEARAAWLGRRHVGILLDNTPDYVFLLAGAALSSAVVVGLNPTRRGAELARDIRHTDCQLVVPDRPDLLDGLDLGPAVVVDPTWADTPRPHVKPGVSLDYTSGIRSIDYFPLVLGPEQ